MSDNAQGYVPVTGPFAIVPDTAGLTDLSPSNDALRNAWFTGNVTAAGFVLSGGGSFLVNPMTTLGDVITGIAAGVPARLGIGAAGQVLTVVAGVPAWAPAPGSNPMTTLGDMIVGGAAGVEARLGIGATAQVLTVVAGVPAWAAPTPMTTAGDLIIGGVAGAATRLGVGTAGQVLTVSAGAPAWVSPTVSGDIRLVTTVTTTAASLVFVNIAGLTANVLAGITYRFKAYIMTVNGSTTGAAFQLTGSATFTALRYWISALVGSSGAWTEQPNANSFAISIGAVGAAVLGIIEGTIVVNAGGTLIPQVANSAAVANTVVQIGSTFILNTIP